MYKKLTAIIIILMMAATPVFGQNLNYPWLAKYDTVQALCNVIKTPPRTIRTKSEPGTFASWLRHLPIRLDQANIYNYKNEKITNPDVSYAIIDIDIGDKDLLQCADAIIRFRSEYFFSRKQLDSIAFDFTSGHNVRFRDWIMGLKPQIDGNNVQFIKTSEIDSSYDSFKRYLEVIFTYAGTHSLSSQLNSVSTFNSIGIGDAFILPGFPGHAVLVTDMAVDTIDGTKFFLLTQGFMPAQDIHVIKNPAMPGNSPWFALQPGDTLEILFWNFTEEHIYRF